MAKGHSPKEFMVPTTSVVMEKLYGALPDWTVAIDPGETVGMAVRSCFYELKPGQAHAADQLMPLSLEPDKALDWVAAWALRGKEVGATPHFIIEEYRIFPDKAMAHAGKTIPTAENIGAFKYLARRLRCRVTEQPASIKRTTAAMLRSRGVPLTGTTRHAKDAELHMWYPILRTLYKKPAGRKKTS